MTNVSGVITPFRRKEENSTDGFGDPPWMICAGVYSNSKAPSFNRVRGRMAGHPQEHKTPASPGVVRDFVRW